MKPRLSHIHRTNIPLHPPSHSFPLPPHTKSSSTFTTPHQISAYLSRPTWSVKSTLLSPPLQCNHPASPPTTITPQTLHHLLSLSALPLPTSPEQESRLLADLDRQLRFVQSIQDVDTEDVEPLVVIRDETVQGLREREVGMGDEEIVTALKGEVRVGKRGRVVSAGKRGKEEVRGRDEEEQEEKEGQEEKKEEDGRKLVDDGLGGKWDPLARAGRTVGRYIVVDTARD